MKTSLVSFEARQLDMNRFFPALIGVALFVGCASETEQQTTQRLNQHGVVAHACCEGDPCCGMNDCCDMNEKKSGEACKNAKCVRIPGNKKSPSNSAKPH
ncbi:MAG: hypothetical protein CMO75_06990 [Verrucomicrobiales bacterium]|nr:hypothetical protein [Verrucomicrobiales bacterium]